MRLVARGCVVAIVVLLAAPVRLARADDEALRSRIATLEEAAERAGATELLDQARRALLTSDRLRVSGDDDGAARAEQIADAAVRAAQRRVEAHRARSDRDAARARVAELEGRARIAREALERARAERERRARAPSAAPAPAPAATATGAPADE